MDPAKETHPGQEMGKQDFDYPSQAIFLYGIDHLDPGCLTAKDRVYLALERLTKREKTEANEQLQSLLDSSGESEEPVRMGDLLGTYDALTLRIDRLKGKDSVAVQSFEKKRNLVESFLNENTEFDLSDNGVSSRTHAWGSAYQSYLGGYQPKSVSGRYRRLATRAAALEVYQNGTGKRDLEMIKADLAEYPRDPAKFIVRMVRESLYLDPLPLSRQEQMLPSVEKESLSPSWEKKVRLELGNYEHLELILEELRSINEILSELGINKQVTNRVLLGTAAQGQIRLKSINPDNYSDIDVLIIVSQEGKRKLDQLKVLAREGEIRLSFSRTSAGSEFFLIKRPSATGELDELEITVCTAADFEKQLTHRNKNSLKTQFVTAAASYGIWEKR